MKKIVAQIFDEFLREYDKNPELRERIERILGPGSEKKRNGQPGRRSRNKRVPAVIDPYREYAGGEEQLLHKLEPLTLDQLKDVVSEYALDSSRLALKWKSRERLVELIVTTIRNRVQKGDVFRAEGKSETKIEEHSDENRS